MRKKSSEVKEQPYRMIAFDIMYDSSDREESAHAWFEYRWPKSKKKRIRKKWHKKYRVPMVVHGLGVAKLEGQYMKVVRK